MTISELSRGDRNTWKWGMDHANDRNWHILEKTADEIKARYYTNGLWNPDANVAYHMIRECAAIAKH